MRGWPEICGSAPALDRDRSQLTGLHELRYALLGSRAWQPEVVAEIGLGGDAARPGRDPPQPALRFSHARRRLIGDLLRQYALERVVQTLEVEPPRGGNLTGE